MSDAPGNGSRLENVVPRNSTIDVDRKAYETLRAECALCGYSLARSHPADGPTIYWASRWGLSRELRTLAEVEAFVQQIGGSAG